MNKIKELEGKVLALEKENKELKEHLSKYTSSACQKTYYQKNKEK